MKRTAPRYLLIYILILCFAHAVYADDSVYNGDGVDVYPLESTDIQMVAEVITVSDRGGRDRFDVDVDMMFKNHGAQTTVQMGFPILADEIEGEHIEFDPNFRTWVNGEEVKITKKRGILNPVKNYPHFSDAVYSYPVTFKQNETINIKHHYAVGGTSDSMGGWRFTYILRTGALWKDAIEKIKIIYRTSTASVHEITCTNPPEQTREQHGEDKRFVWNLTDFEPKSDFIISGNVKRQPTADQTATLETCVDYNQLTAQPLHDVKSSPFDFIFFTIQPNSDGTRDVYIRLFDTFHIISLKKFRPEIVIPLWFAMMLLCGLLSYKNAENKNRDKRFWLIIGALTAPLTLLYVFIISKRK
jgi:hypothetical protein